MTKNWILQIDLGGCPRQYLESKSDGCYRWGADRSKAHTFATKAGAERFLVEHHKAQGAKAVER